MISSRCAACKHLRRRCPSDCIFAPYFPASNKQRFENAHRIYGASNISRMLEDLPVHMRANAADSLCIEANCRQNDPIYGIVGMIDGLQKQIYELQCQLAQVQAETLVANASVPVDQNQTQFQNLNENLNQIQQQLDLDDNFLLGQDVDSSVWYYQE